MGYGFLPNALHGLSGDQHGFADIHRNGCGETLGLSWGIGHYMPPVDWLRIPADANNIGRHLAECQADYGLKAESFLVDTTTFKT